MGAYNKKLFSDLILKAKGSRSLNRFASDVGMDPGYLSRIVNLKRDSPPSVEVIKKIASVADEDVDFFNLMIAAGHIEPSWQSVMTAAQVFNKDSTREQFLQHFETISSKKLTHISDRCLETAHKEPIHIDLLDSTDEACFYVSVPDDSMINSRIKSSDIAFINKQCDVESGDIVLIRINDDRPTLRKIHKYTGQILLLPNNPHYSPILVNTNDIDTKITIYGKVEYIKFKPL